MTGRRCDSLHSGKRWGSEFDVLGNGLRLSGFWFVLIGWKACSSFDVRLGFLPEYTSIIAVVAALWPETYQGWHYRRSWYDGRKIPFSVCEQ